MDIPDPGIEPGFPALQADSLSPELPGKPHLETISSQMVNQKVYFLIDVGMCPAEFIVI